MRHGRFRHTERQGVAPDAGDGAVHLLLLPFVLNTGVLAPALHDRALVLSGPRVWEARRARLYGSGRCRLQEESPSGCPELLPSLFSVVVTVDEKLTGRLGVLGTRKTQLEANELLVAAASQPRLCPCAEQR